MKYVFHFDFGYQGVNIIGYMPRQMRTRRHNKNQETRLKNERISLILFVWKFYSFDLLMTYVCVIASVRQYWLMITRNSTEWIAKERYYILAKKYFANAICLK